MGEGPEKLLEDIEALQAALLAARAELASVRAQQSDDQADRSPQVLRLVSERLTSSVVAARAASPASQRLPASRNSLDQE